LTETLLRILIADDYEIVRPGILALLHWRNDVEIVEAFNGKEAIDQARKTNPGLIILDITAPVMSGIEDARRLGHSTPEITREIYLHAVPEEQRRAVESVERLVFGPKWTQVQAPTQTTSGRVN
jgi:DNA-binding NarL/FixJ family response regulator